MDSVAQGCGVEFQEVLIRFVSNRDTRKLGSFISLPVKSIGVRVNPDISYVLPAGFRKRNRSLDGKTYGISGSRGTGVDVMRMTVVTFYS